MRRRFLISLLAVGLGVAGELAGAQNAAAPAATKPSGEVAAPAASSSPSANSRIVVPSDTTIPLELRSTINSRTAYVGQAIYCQTIFPVTVGNRIVIPVGSYVKGAVTQVVKAGHLKGRAQLGLRFDSLVLPGGTTRPVRGTLSGFGTTGKEGFKPTESKVEGESSKGEKAGKVAQTTVAGAEMGTIIGAVNRSPGKGLGIGSAAGAGAGLIWILASRGKDIILPSGTNLELQLSVPLTFESDEVDPESRYSEGPALPKREPIPPR